jgi:hypothetical protein
MYRGLVVSGAILAIFGGFLVLTDLYIPMGLSGFGIPILVIGLIMFFVGFLRPEPAPVEAEPGKKFCWYCMTQIANDSKECPNCSLPQHDAAD